MDTHRRLMIWREARCLIEDTYELTKALPHDERFTVTPQLRRAAWSVQNNIAEGHAKLGRRERRRFFDVSLGSLAEIDSMLGTLGRLYELDPELVAKIHEHRKRITAGIFAILRSPGR